MGGTDVCSWCDVGRYRDGRERVNYLPQPTTERVTLDLENLPPGFRICLEEEGEES